jgi:hypothetical protein
MNEGQRAALEMTEAARETPQDQNSFAAGLYMGMCDLGSVFRVVLKDDAQDRARLLGYWDSAVKRRAETGSRLWKRLHELRPTLEGS